VPCVYCLNSAPQDVRTGPGLLPPFYSFLSVEGKTSEEHAIPELILASNEVHSDTSGSLGFPNT